MGLLDSAKKFFGVDDVKKSNSNDITDKLDQAASEKQTFDLIKGRLEEIRTSAVRIAHEGIWMQNCAYTVGYSGIYFNTTSRSFQPLNRGGAGVKRNRIYVNKILPNLQNRLAKMTKNPPRYDVRPEDNTQEAKDNARFKLDILTCKYDELQINLERLDLLMWVQEAGHAYAGLFWDDTAGNLIEDFDGNSFFEGDIRFETISPFEVFPDPLARNFKEASYFIRAKVRPLSYFRDRYGEKGATVKGEDTWLLSLQFENKINSMNTRPFSGSATDNAQKDTAIEITYFEKPSPRHPRGRMLVGASGTMLTECDNELPTGKIPLVMFTDTKVAGKYYPESVVTHAKPMQDQYNQVIRRRADWVNKTLAGKYISPRGNELIREALTEEGGEVIQYTPVPNAKDGGEPHALDIPMIPQYAYNEEDKLDTQLSECFGISDVSKGQLPSASIPALGMQILVESDDTRAGVMVLAHEFGYAQVGAHILDYVQRYYKTPRKMKFAGKNSYVIKEVTGDQLVGSNDVMVIPGSTIPGSKALRRQDIMNAYTQGLLGDPADPLVKQLVVGYLEVGDVGEMFLDHSLNNHRVKYEIDSLEAEVMPEIDEGFDHPYHIKELNRYRKSDKWEGLSDTSKQIFLAIREEHLRFLGELSGAMPAGQDQMAQADDMDAKASMPPTGPDEQVAQPMQNEELPQQAPAQVGGM